MTSASGRRRRIVCAAAAACLTCAVAGAVPTAAVAVEIPVRTLALSSVGDGTSANGASSDPVLSADGNVVAFESQATDLATGDENGSVSDIFKQDRRKRQRRLVSVAPGGTAADGPSSDPALSATGATVAFASQATNLVAGDTNEVPDIFVRTFGADVQLVSVSTDGQPADGASSEPDISSSGRFVVFTSAATNLVPGDVNGLPDVFLRDLATGETRRVSTGGKGVSSTPAISGDGRVVSFFSTDPRAVSRDTNRVGDVFVRTLKNNRLERVSVDGRARQQNQSVQPPFTQVSDLSRDGRYVTFDSDASNLARGDRNRDTDVFLRDRQKHTTERVSLSSAQAEGDNDSFNPTITSSGRFIAFESFAGNLASADRPREDVFVRDRRAAATSLISLAADGRAPGNETVRELLQRPMVSANGEEAVFTSTAGNVVNQDTNGVEDVFVRLMSAPATKQARIVSRAGRARALLRADDPRASRFLCRIDRQMAFECPVGGALLPQLSAGPHTLSVRAGGPGMLYEAEPRVLRFQAGGR